MLGQIGLPGIILIVLIVLLLFGSKNLPKIGKSVGESLREFKSAFGTDTKPEIENNEDKKLVDMEKKREEIGLKNND